MERTTKEQDIQEIPKQDIIAAMPPPSALAGDDRIRPVHYSGGVIYTVQKQRTFRALRERGDGYTESSSTWGKKRTAEEAWARCVMAINEHRKQKQCKGVEKTPKKKSTASKKHTAKTK